MVTPSTFSDAAPMPSRCIWRCGASRPSTTSAAQGTVLLAAMPARPVTSLKVEPGMAWTSPARQGWPASGESPSRPADNAITSQLCMPGRKSGQEAMASISPGLSPASIITTATRASPWSGGSVASVLAD